MDSRHARSGFYQFPFWYTFIFSSLLLIALMATLTGTGIFALGFNLASGLISNTTFATFLDATISFSLPLAIAAIGGGIAKGLVIGCPPSPKMPTSSLSEVTQQLSDALSDTSCTTPQLSLDESPPTKAPIPQSNSDLIEPFKVPTVTSLDKSTGLANEDEKVNTAPLNKTYDKLRFGCFDERKMSPNTASSHPATTQANPEQPGILYWRQRAFLPKLGAVTAALQHCPTFLPNSSMKIGPGGCPHFTPALRRLSTSIEENQVDSSPKLGEPACSFIGKSN